MIHGQRPPPEKTLIKPLGVVARQSTDVLAIGDQATAVAVHFIREHAGGGISVEKVPRHVQLSRSTLEHRFAKLLGRSPKDEIICVRLQRVKRLLTETDYTLERIAQLAGFTHLENLWHFFKSRTGGTMGQYRKETRTQTPTWIRNIAAEGFAQFVP